MDNVGRRVVIRIAVEIIILIILFLDVCAGAVPAEEWNKTFGGTNIEEAWSVQQTADGGYIIAGYLWSGDIFWADALLIRTNASGDEQWNKTFGVIGNDGATSVQQTLDEGYIFVGYTYRPGYNNDAWIIKTDVLGNGQKENIFGGTDLDEAKSVQQTSDGGYIIAGYTQSYGAGSGDAWLIKTDASGQEQWNKTFGGSSSDRAESVQQTSDGGYIIAGNTQSYGAGSGDAWLIKTDAKGNLEWSKTFGGTKNDGVWFVQQASDRGYILAGWTYSYGAGSMDAWLIKTDANGNEQWNKTFGGAGGDGIRYVRQTSDGGYILAGSSNSYNTDYQVNAWLIKISSAQTELPKTPAFETLLAIGAMLLVLLVRKGKIK